MTWDWDRLSDVVRRLKLPPGEYVVGRVGYGLSRDRASTADRVELLVTETGRRRLKERGWREAGGGAGLRHPQERQLTASVVVLDDVRHDVVEVDGVPVIAVDPDPPAAVSQTWRQRLGLATFGVVSLILLGAFAYGATLLSPTPDAATIGQHLAFRTERVEATVGSSSEIGSCTGSAVYDRRPRMTMTLTWTQDGQVTTSTYEGCGASVDSPQDVWVTANGVVASQHAPWVDHFWPLLIVGLVPFAFVVMPLATRLRAHVWRRRRG